MDQAADSEAAAALAVFTAPEASRYRFASNCLGQFHGYRYTAPDLCGSQSGRFISYSEVMADSAASNQIPGFISNPRYGLPAVANLRKTAFDGKSLSGF